MAGELAQVDVHSQSHACEREMVQLHYSPLMRIWIINADTMRKLERDLDERIIFSAGTEQRTWQKVKVVFDRIKSVAVKIDDTYVEQNHVAGGLRDLAVKHKKKRQ